ncbi:D-tyrosyl-tRNA(Tyr) deacylase [Cryptococcus sp. DSM 104549]
MKAVIQRVISASVAVEGKTISSIGKGLLVLVGIDRYDTPADATQIIKKVLTAKLFDDENGALWKRNVKDIEGEVLCVSQFTLLANFKKSAKPDFHESMSTIPGRELYTSFMDEIRASYNPSKIQDGQFGAMMQVSLCNDGPTTILLDTNDKKPSKSGSSTPAPASTPTTKTSKIKSKSDAGTPKPSSSGTAIPTPDGLDGEGASRGARLPATDAAGGKGAGEEQEVSPIGKSPRILHTSTMKAVIQRVTSASVAIDGKTIASIGKGYLILLGIDKIDTPADATKVIKKVLSAKLFDDEEGRLWKRNVVDIRGEILCVSQFTLLNYFKGTNPNFHQSMSPAPGKEFYNSFMDEIRKAYDTTKIQEGQFGGYMAVSLCNDGPTTILLDTHEKPAAKSGTSTPSVPPTPTTTSAPKVKKDKSKASTRTTTPAPPSEGAAALSSEAQVDSVNGDAGKVAPGEGSLEEKVAGLELGSEGKTEST